MIWRSLRSLPRWNWTSPFEELDSMRRDMERLFEDFRGRYLRAPMAGVFPLINFTEDSGNYYIRAELPGVKAEDLDISVTNDSLTLSGERKIPAEKENAKYHRREREAGKFSRIMSLPGLVDSDKVEAHCIDGVLNVVLPKAEESKPKQIAVKLG